ncbi:MAG: hypothetical protein ACJ71C_04345 [Nitrososphaeraceae archaeon]
MVFKDLQKLVSQSQQENTCKELFQRLQGKPFWIWDIAEYKHNQQRLLLQSYHRLPQKNGMDKPLYDYEGIIFDYLVTHNGNTSSHGKHLWIKKATGQFI